LVLEQFTKLDITQAKFGEITEIIAPRAKTTPRNRKINAQRLASLVSSSPVLL